MTKHSLTASEDHAQIILKSPHVSLLRRDVKITMRKQRKNRAHVQQKNTMPKCQPQNQHLQVAMQHDAKQCRANSATIQKWNTIKCNNVRTERAMQTTQKAGTKMQNTPHTHREQKQRS